MDLSTLCNKASQPLEAASSLPFEVYSDPAILVEEARQIFHKEWVFVCMAQNCRIRRLFCAASRG